MRNANQQTQHTLSPQSIGDIFNDSAIVPGPTGGDNYRQHHPPRSQRRAKRESLGIDTPEVIGRLLDEGVPVSEAYYVAAETQRCVDMIADGDDLSERTLHPWTLELIARYSDKIEVLFMTTGGEVDPR